MADLVEIDRMLREVRARYVHAYDLAYSSGGGGGGVAGRGQLQYVDPTQATALTKDGARFDVERASRAVARMVRDAHAAHSALVDAMPGADPYQPTWRAGEQDAIATRAERVAAALKQRERTTKGEM